MIQRPVGFHCTVIHKAFAAGDKANVINAYLDILDYDRELNYDSTVLQKVVECISYSEAIDHVLFGHVKEQMEKYNLDTRLHSAIYYLNIKGGLTAVDLLKAIADDTTVSKLPNSEAFKSDFIEKLTSESDDETDKIDKYVLE